MVIFTTLILTIYDHKKSLHLLVSSSISFFKVLKFSLNRSFASLVGFTLGYFLFFVSYCAQPSPFFSMYLSMVHRKATDFCLLVLCYAKSVDLFQKFSCGVIRVSHVKPHRIRKQGYIHVFFFMFVFLSFTSLVLLLYLRLQALY